MITEETKKQAAIAIIQEIAGIIKDSTTSSPLSGIPSGHLYANLMGHMSLDMYNQIINKLKELGLVKETNFLLQWVGPK